MISMRGLHRACCTCRPADAVFVLFRAARGGLGMRPQAICLRRRQILSATMGRAAIGGLANIKMQQNFGDHGLAQLSDLGCHTAMAKNMLFMPANRTNIDIHISTIPKIAVPSWRNMLLPSSAQSSAPPLGVDPITTPSKCAFCAKVMDTSPVLGDRSTRRPASANPQVSLTPVWRA